MTWRSVRFSLKYAILALIGIILLTCARMPVKFAQESWVGPAAGRYLNIHQCVYQAGNSYFTNFLPNIADTPFRSGTNLSNFQADTSPKCGTGSSGWSQNSSLSGLFVVDFNGGSMGRYLNIHQCSYYNTYANTWLTNIMPNLGNAAFNAGTNQSNNIDSTPKCAQGDPTYAWYYEPGYSGVYTIDLWHQAFDTWTSGHFLNIHQCVYSGGYTNILPNAGGPAFGTGTNVSDILDTSQKCGSSYSDNINSDTYDIDLWYSW